MPRHINTTAAINQKFNRWTVLEYSHSNKGEIFWLCQCECGTIRSVRKSGLTSNKSKSCGCLRPESTRKLWTKHGQYKSTEYMIFTAMHQRCENPNATGYPYYGGRGICVCERWSSFENFIADVGQRPSSAYSLERVKNDANYEPGNVVWATRKQQLRNMRSNVWLTFNGETLIITDWKKKTGISCQTIKHRLKRGLPIEQALTLPLRNRLKQ